MTVTVDRSPATNGSVLPPPVRLSLTPAHAAPGPLDGAWWPRSRDLSAELPALAETLDRLWGRITRITVNSGLWPTVPRTIPVTGHVVRVGSFTTEQDLHDLLLLSYTVGRWDLLVVPPETDADAADRLMSAAADPHNVFTACRLMANEDTIRRAADAAGGGEEEWESEGGALPSSDRGCSAEFDDAAQGV
ncbi:DUF5994 family protein [Streptomyces sp. NPDC055722]